MKLLTGAVIYHLSFNIVVVIAKYNFIHTNDLGDSVRMSCDTTLQCEEMGFNGFKCIDNLCTCSANIQCEKPDATVLVTKIGKNCTTVSECNIDKSFCNKEGKCDCVIDTVASKDQRMCLNVSYNIGSKCQEDVQCIQLNGVCKEGKCNCSNDMHVAKGICFKSVGLESLCKRDEECSHISLSSCVSNKCVCNQTYIGNKAGTECLPKAQNYLSLCHEDIQCSSTLGRGSVCLNGLCMCKELHQYKSTIKKCVLDARLGEECSTHSDCHQPGHGESRLECVIGVCKCKPDYFEDEGYCISNSSENKMPFHFRDILPYVITYLIFYIII